MDSGVGSGLFCKIFAMPRKDILLIIASPAKWEDVDGRHAGKRRACAERRAT